MLKRPWLAAKARFELRQAIADGASSRLRAILLTTITTLGGVLPMAYGIGGDAGYTKFIAFSLGWWLLTATVTTLLFLPVFVEIRADIAAMGRILALPRRWRVLRMQWLSPDTDRFGKGLNSDSVPIDGP